jgi:hypothetical protein
MLFWRLRLNSWPTEGSAFSAAELTPSEFRLFQLSFPCWPSSLDSECRPNNLDACIRLQ